MVEYIEYAFKIVKGICTGVAWSLSGFGKVPGEDFDFVIFGKSIGVGAGVGLLAGLLDIPFESGLEFFAAFGVTGLIENGVKTVWRRWLSRFFEK